MVIELSYNINKILTIAPMAQMKNYKHFLPLVTGNRMPENLIKIIILRAKFYLNIPKNQK